MRELLNDWFGPVLDAAGNRVRLRTSRPALALHVASMAFSVATVALAVLTFTDASVAPLWPATFIAATLHGIASRKQLRQTVTALDDRN